MKKIKENLNLIIGLLTFLFIGFIIYNSFIKEDKVANVEDIVIGSENNDTSKILDILNQINNIKIDNSFFNKEHDPNGYSLAFNELEDFSQPIPNKRPGKINPFIRGGAISYIGEETVEGAVDGENTEVNGGVDNNQVVQEEIIAN